MSQSIEDIILQQDKRGVAELRPHLSPDFCRQAARYVLDHPGHTVIVTGYYITMSGGPETDGPAGAIAIGQALQSLGRQVTYVTDSFTVTALRQLAGDGAEVVEFPIADVETSRRNAAQLLERLQPDLLVSIERSGRTRDETYLNMRDVDITPHTARVDYLFDSEIPSVAIGDGGNEIGMGNLAEVIPSVERLPNNPSVVKVDRLIIASVSNWGGYGLVAALSQLTGKDLLPSVEHETGMLDRMVEMGIVDGTTGEAIPAVDGFSAEENGAVLEQLRQAAGE